MSLALALGWAVGDAELDGVWEDTLLQRDAPLITAACDAEDAALSFIAGNLLGDSIS